MSLDTNITGKLSTKSVKLLAEEHDGIKADLTLIGKALSGGCLVRKPMRTRFALRRRW